MFSTFFYFSPSIVLWSGLLFLSCSVVGGCLAIPRSLFEEGESGGGVGHGQSGIVERWTVASNFLRSICTLYPIKNSLLLRLTTWREVETDNRMVYQVTNWKAKYPIILLLLLLPHPPLDTRLLGHVHLSCLAVISYTLRAMRV